MECYFVVKIFAYVLGTCLLCSIKLTHRDMESQLTREQQMDLLRKELDQFEAQQAQQAQKTESRSKYDQLSRPDSGYFEIQVEVLSETDKAVCFNGYNGYLNHTKPVWFPKSQMEIVQLSEGGTRYFAKNWLYYKIK